MQEPEALMNREEARALVIRPLSDVAPEIDVDAVDPELPFQEQPMSTRWTS